MTRVLRPGWGTMAGLRWLSRVGPAPLDAWRCAMGWSEVAARSHARRLEREGWLARYPMRRGDGCLFVATRVGVAVAGVPVRAPGEPAPTWWAHHCGVAWMAAWLTVRPREFKGSRELLAFDTWSDTISWWDRKGHHESRHRPDLVGFRLDGRPIAVEVELAPKSIERLRAILYRHVVWRHAGKSNGVHYICGDEDGLRADREGRQDGANLQVRRPRAHVDVARHDQGSRRSRCARRIRRAVGFRRPAADAVGHGR